MRIAVGSDHRGFAMREKLIELYGSLTPPDRRCFKLTFEFLGEQNPGATL